jgi:hypothetical protein
MKEKLILLLLNLVFHHDLALSGAFQRKSTETQGQDESSKAAPQ